MQINSLLPRLYRPPVYQGKRNPQKYFECTYYQRYPLSSFSFERKEFLIRVGNSTFTSSGISLDIVTEGFSVKGDLGPVKPFRQ